MSLLQARHLTFSFPGQDPLFCDVDLELTPGWYGLVGPNGAGKTTFLRLVAGSLRPVDGLVRRVPDSGRVITCPQTVEAQTEGIRSFAEDMSRSAFRLRGKLELEPEDLARWSSLSPGERKRWQVGAALARAPDILLLDEPTNHLDRRARDLLLTALMRYSGIGILVSHQRPLLDALTKRTLRLAGGRIRAYDASYSAARALWEEEAENASAERSKLKSQERVLARRLQSKRERRAKAERSRSAGARMKNARDSDGRSMGAQFRADQAEAGLGRGVELARRELERLQELIKPGERDRSLGRSVFAGYARAPKSQLMVLDAEEVRAGDTILLSDVHLVLGRSDRVRLVGPNGAGKTTLVRALLEQARLPGDRVLHLPQELTSEESLRLLDLVRGAPPEERGRILSVVAALGIDPDRVLSSGAPSPGEARKLALGLGLGRHAWVLVLDEPTNHLDLDSVERIETALAAYPGALLVVTHDERFCGDTLSTIWSIRGGRVETAGCTKD